MEAPSPKPVRPIAVRTHGLFGIPFVRQHMVSDKNWRTSDLTEEFQRMTNLLAKRNIAHRLETISKTNKKIREYRHLRNVCRDGRQKLQMILYGSNALRIGNYLIRHKNLQRLYQNMPIHLVVDNINQRTFAMRKERDRLRSRLNHLNLKYKDRLITRAGLTDRIKYENEFTLIEEIQSWKIRKNIENSKTRLSAIKTISGTYRKMLQVLRQDSLFYEPILQSLDNDIGDQAQFIKHVLHCGVPAIAKFKELSEQYRIFDERIRRDLHSKIQLFASFKTESRRPSQMIKTVKIETPVNLSKRYVRETNSMIVLKNALEDIESEIKEMKMATLCSQGKEIYPRIKNQRENNAKLEKEITKDGLGLETVEIKMKRAEVFQSVLTNDLSAEEKIRQEKIKKLEEAIKEEDEKEVELLKYLKNRSEAYVILRVSLWNLYDILRNVDRPTPPARLDYPESYLKLPLLKFDMLTMCAVPPPVFETKVDEIMEVVKRKTEKLMTKVGKDLTPKLIEEYEHEYIATFLDNIQGGDVSDESTDIEEVAIVDAKAMQGILSRKQIKAESAKIVEEWAKKEE